METNKGILILSEARRGPLMISGAGRSGTTAMMRCMVAAGFTATDGTLDGVNAEGELTPAFQGFMADKVRAISRAGGNTFVAKVPVACIRAASFPEMRRAWNGNWLIIMRDPVALACREVSVRGDNAASSRHILYSRATEAHQVIASAIELSMNAGVALVSYEKLLSSASLVLDGIEGWLSIKLNKDAALGQIIANDPRYLQP